MKNIYKFQTQQDPNDESYSYNFKELKLDNQCIAVNDHFGTRQPNYNHITEQTIYNCDLQSKLINLMPNEKNQGDFQAGFGTNRLNPSVSSQTSRSKSFTGYYNSAQQKIKKFQQFALTHESTNQIALFDNDLVRRQQSGYSENLFQNSAIKNSVDSRPQLSASNSINQVRVSRNGSTRKSDRSQQITSKFRKESQNQSKMPFNFLNSEDNNSTSRICAIPLLIQSNQIQLNHQHQNGQKVDMGCQHSSQQVSPSHYYDQQIENFNMLTNIKPNYTSRNQNYNIEHQKINTDNKDAHQFFANLQSYLSTHNKPTHYILNQNTSTSQASRLVPGVTENLNNINNNPCIVQRNTYNEMTSKTQAVNSQNFEWSYNNQINNITNRKFQSGSREIQSRQGSRGLVATPGIENQSFLPQSNWSSVNSATVNSGTSQYLNPQFSINGRELTSFTEQIQQLNNQQNQNYAALLQNNQFNNRLSADGPKMRKPNPELVQDSNHTQRRPQPGVNAILTSNDNINNCYLLDEENNSQSLSKKQNLHFIDIRKSIQNQKQKIQQVILQENINQDMTTIEPNKQGNIIPPFISKATLFKKEQNKH